MTQWSRWLVMACVVSVLGCGGSDNTAKTSAKKTGNSKSSKKPAAEPAPAPPPKPKKPKIVVPADAYAGVPEALKAYRGALSSNNGDEADKVEGWFETTNATSIPALSELLKNPSTTPEVQMDASRALGRCGPNAASALLEVIGAAKIPQVRIKAIESVSILKPTNPTIIKTLQGLMNDAGRDSQTRQHAILGLQRIGPPAKDVVPDLMNILNNTKENDTVRSAAKAALKEIDPRKGFHGMKLD